jgi:uncharacterized protein (TIGR03118 family)
MVHLALPRTAEAIAVVAAGILAAHAGAAEANSFGVTNLVSDGSVPAAHVDADLINPWGVAYGPGGPFWVSDNNSGFSTIYNGSGGKIPLTVSIPSSTGSGIGSPDGIVFNGSGGFNVSNGTTSGSSVFLFATEDGTIQGWSPSVALNNSFIAVNNFNGNVGAVYKGLTMGSTGGSDFLYAANFRGGDVEMYNSSFGLVGTFTDPNVDKGYAPFNVQDLGGTLYVTFALQDAAKHDDVAGAGNGYVDAFSLDGKFESRIASVGGNINSPWGLDIAPASFGHLAGDLLVGNFGDGTISVYNPTTDDYEGKLLGGNGQPIVEGDLWALITGGGGADGSPNDVYFTAGVAQESHGLFGSIASVPEPRTWALMIVGLGLMGASLRSRRTAQAPTTA